MNQLVNEEKSIISCHDFELGVERKEKLFYKYSYLSSQKLKGIVFLIHGFGAQPSYMDNLREFVAREFSVVAVDVYYHCFFSRLNNRATLKFDSFDVSILNQLIEQYDINLTSDDTKTVDLVLNKLNNEVERLKIINIFEKNFKLQLPLTLVPDNNEYQNFGVMQAIDHINVLHEIEKLPIDFIDNYSVSILGTSHGGYLAHLIAKFAPHKIDFIIDNASYVTPPLTLYSWKRSRFIYRRDACVLS